MSVLQGLSDLDHGSLGIQCINVCDTVDSVVFVGYQFSLVQVNREFKCSTNIIFSIGFVYRDWQNH